MSGRPAVFLDRDGVINRPLVRNGKPYPPASLDELEILPGAVHSLKRIAAAGYILIAVTNQPDVARGTQTLEAVEAINTRIVKELPVTEIFTCYHDNKDDCTCRKPKPGLILQGAEKYSTDMTASWMVGDRWKDISAGWAAGLRTVFVDYHYNEMYSGPPADFIIEDVAALAEIVLSS
jgi:D-glycero-D-manno-heptose 1,7-bisphosphate phosphatase